MAQTGVAQYGNTTFNGVGAYSTVNSNNLAGGAVLAQPVVYFIGTSVGGKPGQIIRLKDEGTARSTLKGGDLLDAYLFARRHGAGEVDVYRVSPATQSSLLLYDASNNPSILLTSNDYGNYTNSFAASISGSPGSIIATFVDAYDSVTKPSNALGPVATLQYTGNGTSATVTVVKTLTAVGTLTFTDSTTGGTIASGTTVNVQVFGRNASGVGVGSTVQSTTVGATTSTNSVSVNFSAVVGATSYDVYVDGAYYGNTKTTTINVTFIPTGTSAPPTTVTAGPNLNTVISGQTDGSQNLDINLSALTVSTVSALASFITGQVGYSMLTTPGQGAITSTLIDAISNVNILASVSLTADVAVIINWFNQTGYVTATQPTGAVNAPAAISLAPFTGGSDGTQTTTNWQNAANLISIAVPQLRYPVALTDSVPYRQIVSTAITQAAALMTTYFSRGFAGGGTSDSDATAENNAAALGSDRMYYAHSDFYDYNSAGVYTHFPSYILAACYAGLAAGNSPETPLTNQVLKINALGGLDSNNQPITAQRALALAQAGVSSAFLASDGTIRIYQGISTDLIAADQTNTYKVEFSVGNAVDTLRIFIDTDLGTKFRGGKNYGASTSAAVLSELNADLGLAKNSYKWIADFTPASSITLSPTNSTFLITNATVFVVNPINGLITNISLSLPQMSASPVA